MSYGPYCEQRYDAQSGPPQLGVVLVYIFFCIQCGNWLTSVALTSLSAQPDYMHVFRYESRYLKLTNGQNLKIAGFQGTDYRKSKNPNFRILETMS